MLETLKDKILYLPIILVVVISLSVLTFSYTLMTNSLRRIQEEKLQFAVGIVSSHLRHEIEERKENLKIIADSKEVDIYHKKRQNPELTQYFMRFREEFPVLGFIEHDKTEHIWLIEGRASYKPRSVIYEPLFRTAVANPGKVVDTVLNDPDAGPIMEFALALETYFDEPIGVIIGEVPLPDLTGTVLSMAEIKVGSEGFLIVVTRNGEILYHPDNDMAFEKLSYSGDSAEKLVFSALSLNAGFGRGSILGHDSFVAYAPVEGEGWSLMMVLPYEEFIATPNRLANYTLAFSAVLLLTVGYLAMRFGRKVSESLGRLSELVRNIARGDLTRKVTVDSADELGDLGMSLNMMSEALRISRDKIESARISLHNLLEHILSVREEERKRISYRVHNELSQALVTMKLNLAWMKRKLPKNSEELIGKLEETSEMVESMAAMAQDITSSLRPIMLDNLGLEAAINWEADNLKKKTGIKFSVDIAPEISPFGKGTSEVLFRVCQEALTNIARHAGATEVGISLSAQNGRARLVVRDNGRGITEEEINASTSYGLMGMRESIQNLGGEFQVSGEEGNGTTLSVSIPMKAEEGQTP